jgi:hypothetical protein
MDHLRGYENVGHVLDVLSQMHADIAGVIGALHFGRWKPMGPPSTHWFPKLIPSWIACCPIS